MTFDGEDALSGKAYPLAAGFVPRPSQRVYLIPQGHGYIIAGAVGAQTHQGFGQSRDGTWSAVEFGGGSYWDSDVGMVLETDATVQGQIQHGPRGLRVPEVQFGSVSLSFSSLSSYEQSVAFPTTWPTGTTVRMPAPNIASISGSTGSYQARAHSITNAGFTLWVGVTDAARPAQSWSGIPVHWVAYATPTV